MKSNHTISDYMKECIVAFLQDDITHEQHEAFDKWVKNDTNGHFFNELKVIWETTGQNSKLFDSDKAWKEIEHIIAAKQPKRKKYEYHPYLQLYRKMRPVLRIAAMLLIAYASGLVTYWITEQHTGKDQYIEITAPKGSRTFVTLDDGTKVWLNAASRFRYPKNYGQVQRNVSLIGEAYFEVAKNKDIPFVVNANNIKITALGTAFNVKAYEEDGHVETTLTEGSVRVEGNTSPVVLLPGQKVVLRTDQIIRNIPENRDTNDITTPHIHTAELPAIEMEQPVSSIIQLADTRPYTSWKDPRWVFKQQNLAELAIKLERRYDVTFSFEDKHLQDYVVSGTLLDETLEQVLKTLQHTAPIDYRIDHKTVFLKENPRLKKKYMQLTK